MHLVFSMSKSVLIFLEEFAEDRCTHEVEESDLDGVMVGEWDLDSTMNYCNPDRNNHGELSEGDITTIRRDLCSTA